MIVYWLYLLFLFFIVFPLHIICRLFHRKSWLTQLNKNYEDWVDKKYDNEKYEDWVNR